MIDKELALRNVIGTMATEGIQLADEDIQGVRQIIDGEVDVESAIAKVREQYIALGKADRLKAAAS